MSKLGKLRKKVNYETNVPRCQTCVHYRKAPTFLRNSLPIKGQALCVQYHFTVAPMSVCDSWKSSSGDTLYPLDRKMV